MSSPASSEILIRPARSDDAVFVAGMICLSMDALADYLFQGTGQSAFEIVKNLVIRNAGRFGSEITFVAEADGKPLGALLACRGSKLDALNLSVLRHVFPVMGVVPALRFLWRGYRLPGGREAEQDEYYLSNLGVPASAQGKGIGSLLLNHAERMAQADQLDKCSLIVGLHNINALRLYQRTGYQIVETVHDKNETLGYHRLVKPLLPITNH